MRTLTLGTDCTGIDAAYYALKKILPKHSDIDYKFASEIEGDIRELLKVTTKPARLFVDLTKRDVANDMCHVDLYIAGFPCYVNVNGWSCEVVSETNIFIHRFDRDRVSEITPQGRIDFTGKFVFDLMFTGQAFF